MKKIILSIVFAGTCLMACDRKNDVVPEIQFNSGSTKVAYRQNSLVDASGQELMVDLKEVNDSRCPINANCITAGSAVIVFAISDNTNNAIVTGTLTGDGKNDKAGVFVLGKQKYALKVTGVLPYPEIEKEPKLEDYNVAVVIVKL